MNVNLAVPTGTTPSSGQLAFMLAQIGDLQMASDGLIDRGAESPKCSKTTRDGFACRCQLGKCDSKRSRFPGA